MIFTKDNLRLGLVLGILGPLAGLVAVYFIKFPSLSFKEFLDYFMHDNKVITNVGLASTIS